MLEDCHIKAIKHFRMWCYWKTINFGLVMYPTTPSFIIFLEQHTLSHFIPCLLNVTITTALFVLRIEANTPSTCLSLLCWESSNTQIILDNSRSVMVLCWPLSVHVHSRLADTLCIATDELQKVIVPLQCRRIRYIRSLIKRPTSAC